MDKQQLMQYIAQAESSNGKFREHPYVQSGVQKGTRSVSSYGIMPTTAYEMVQRNKELQGTPLGQQLLETKGDPEEINRITSDTKNDSDLMENLLDDSHKRIAPYLSNEDNPEAALLFAHRRGVPAAVQSLQKGDMGYLQDPYVKPYLDQGNTSSNTDTLDQQAKLRAIHSLMNPPSSDGQDNQDDQ